MLVVANYDFYRNTTWATRTLKDVGNLREYRSCNEDGLFVMFHVWGIAVIIRKQKNINHGSRVHCETACRAK